MVEITFKQVDNGLEDIFFQLEPVQSPLTVNTEFSLFVNESDSSLVKLNCNVTAFGNGEEDTFLKMQIYGIYETNNTNPKLKLEEIENYREFLESLLPLVNEVFSFVTEKGLGDRMELPEQIPSEN